MLLSQEWVAEMTRHDGREPIPSGRGLALQLIALRSSDRLTDHAAQSASEKKQEKQSEMETFIG